MIKNLSKTKGGRWRKGEGCPIRLRTLGQWKRGGKDKGIRAREGA